MELTSSFLDLLPHFAPVFTAPTYQTFVVIVTGWVLSQRHRFITEVIFSGGHVGIGHWARFHRFFSHAAWDIDAFSMALARMVVTILAPGAELLWAVDDTLCRKRGLTLYGAGMHYDPLISSRSKALVSWGHDWVVLCLIVVHPFWASTKVFALPIAVRREHSISVGSLGDLCADCKCLSLKMVPASCLVVRTQQQNGFRTLLVPVDTWPLQPQVHHSADRTLDRTTADRHLQRRDPRVIPPTLLTIPLEVRTLPFQRLARARATECVDRRLHLDHLSLQKTSPLATNPRLTLRSRPASRQGRDLAQMLHRMIEVHQLGDLFRFDPQATHQCPDAIPDPTRPVGHEQDLVRRGDG